MYKALLLLLPCCIVSREALIYIWSIYCLDRIDNKKWLKGEYMSNISFEAFVQDIEDNKWNVHGVEIYKTGKLVNSYGDTMANR